MTLRKITGMVIGQITVPVDIVTLGKITGTVISQMTVPVLSSTITSKKLTSMPFLELYTAFQVQY